MLIIKQENLNIENTHFEVELQFDIFSPKIGSSPD